MNDVAYETKVPVSRARLANLLETLSMMAVGDLDPPKLRELLENEQEDELGQVERMLCTLATDLAEVLRANEAYVAEIEKTASDLEEKLRTTPGLRGTFTNEQSERYTATVEAVLEILDNRGARIGMAEARVQRSRTVPENITLNDRERTWYELTETALRDMDATLTRNVQTHLGRFLR